MWRKVSVGTVKKSDEVVRHPHLVTQDQFRQVSKKDSDIPEENFTINIELFRHFSQVSN
jgi:crotonobetainyl-CoA:carnitine CoA-transferase CaiB-like acyl-CoA transferase